MCTADSMFSAKCTGMTVSSACAIFSASLPISTAPRSLPSMASASSLKVPPLPQPTCDQHEHAVDGLDRCDSCRNIGGFRIVDVVDRADARNKLHAVWQPGKFDEHLQHGAHVETEQIASCQCRQRV